MRGGDGWVRPREHLQVLLSAVLMNPPKNPHRPLKFRFRLTTGAEIPFARRYGPFFVTSAAQHLSMRCGRLWKMECLMTTRRHPQSRIQMTRANTRRDDRLALTRGRPDYDRWRLKPLYPPSML